MDSDPYVKVTFTGKNRVIANEGHKTQVIKKVSPLHLSLSLSLFSSLFLSPDTINFLPPPLDPSSSMEPNTTFPGQ